MNFRLGVIVLLGAAALASPGLVGCATNKASSPQHQAATPPRNSQEDQRLAEQSARTLKKCGISVAWYCSKHGDIALRSMADIADSPYGPSPEELHSPFGPAPDGRPDYMFRTDMVRYECGNPDTPAHLPIAKFDFPPKALMAIDRSAVLVGSSRIPVLFNDAHTEVLSREELAAVFYERAGRDIYGWSGLENSQYLEMGWLSGPDRVATNYAMIEAWGFQDLFTDPYPVK